MRFRELRHLFQQIVIAGLPVTAACVGDPAEDKYQVGSTNCGITNYAADTVVDVPAPPPMQLRLNACRLDADACTAVCSEVMRTWEIAASPSTCDVTFPGRVEVSMTWTTGESCGAGRKPAGHVPARCLDAPNAIGAYLADAAWLEAVSVYAFVQLARELEHHGAPRILVRLAKAAARDEVRHAALVGELAATYGARPPVAEVTLPAMRSLDEIAVENAVEGCVRETWGAVIAFWQSNTATDPKIRDAFRLIARDEARHAALAWAVDAWIATKLDATAYARVAAARTVAARALAATSMQPSRALGLPSVEAAEGLLARTQAALWAGGGA